MGSARASTSAQRKARIEEMRKAERARERRNRILTITASTVIVAGLVVGGVLVSRSPTAAAPRRATRRWLGALRHGKDGVETWSGTLSRNHVTKTVKYPMEPPVGGNHNPVWMNCNGDVYGKAINNMNAVHSLEHGAVWVTYNSKASDATRRRSKRRSRRRRTP